MDRSDDSMIPCIDDQGRYISSVSMVLKKLLQSGNPEEAMGLLKSGTMRELGIMLSENGFGSPNGLKEQDRERLIFEIQLDIGQACANRVDGFGLNDILHARNPQLVPLSSRKLHDIAVHGQKNEIDESFRHADFLTNRDAAANIQKILKSPYIEIELLGGEALPGRHALQFIAGQSLKSNLHGFKYEGFDGKYEIKNAGMEQMVELHSEAARSIALESVRFALGEWTDGKKPGPLSDYVLESVAKEFRSSLNINSAMKIISALQDGSVGDHAAKLGRFEYGQIMRQMGIDIEADSVGVQADKIGLAIARADLARGEYIGPVVGADHKSLLVKYAREKAIVIDKRDIDSGREFNIGDELHIQYKLGKMSCNLNNNRGKSVQRGI